MIVPMLTGSEIVTVSVWSALFALAMLQIVTGAAPLIEYVMLSVEWVLCVVTELRTFRVRLVSVGKNAPIGTETIIHTGMVLGGPNKVKVDMSPSTAF